VECCSSKCGRKYKRYNKIFSFLNNTGEEDLDLSIKKWDEFYTVERDSYGYKELYKKYLKNNYTYAYNQINEYIEIKSNTVFLEIGCGPMFFGRAIANKCNLVVGIDFSITALKLAENMFEKNGISNYLLIHGDIKHLPIKENVIDIVYGNGVIEHFENTLGAIREFYRVLKNKGVSFNTVPMLNIGSLTYRQLWGNIPNFPIIKQIAEFIHIKVFRSKHMRFGYEMSFLRSDMKKMHKMVGFKKVYTEKYDTTLLFEFIPIKKIKSLFIWLAENSPLFWPMIKVVGIK